MTYKLKSDNGHIREYEFLNAPKTQPPSQQKQAKNTSARNNTNAKNKNGGKPNQKNNMQRSGVSPQKRKTKPQTKPKTKPKTNVKKASAVKLKKADPQIHTVRAVTVIPFPTAVISMALICTMLFMFLIMSFVNINEYTIENDKLKFKLDELNKEYRELSLDLEKKNNLNIIEKIAKEDLGMVKADQLANKVYISIPNEDKIVVNDPKDAVKRNPVDIFDSIGKNFKDIFEYIN